jgi:hypothetical protein
VTDSCGGDKLFFHMCMTGRILEICAHLDVTAAAYAVRISRRTVCARIAAPNGVSFSGFQIDRAFSSLYIDCKAVGRQVPHPTLSSNALQSLPWSSSASCSFSASS